MDSRVSSVLAPSGFAAPASSGFPESCICGWVDDDSRSSSNFASSARLRMNLRIQSGFAHFRPTLDAFSQYHSGSTCRQADLCTSDFNCILHRLPSRNCVSFRVPTYMLYRGTVTEGLVRASMLPTTGISTFTFITRSGFPPKHSQAC